MSIPIKYSHQNGVFHFVASGAMHHGENLHMWKYIQDIAVEHKAKRILIECASSCGRISMDHCFDLIELIPFMSRHLACKIALFEQYMNEETREILKFLEVAITDRGAYFKLFSGLEEARLWLIK